MDRQLAQASLNEIEDRQRQVATTTDQQGSPWWYVTGFGAFFLLITVGVDLGDLWGPGWPGMLADYAFPLVGIAAVWALDAALHRSMGVKARRPTRRAATRQLVLVLLFLVVYIALGTALRLHDVEWDSTLSGVAATLVFVGCSLALRSGRADQ